MIESELQRRVPLNLDENPSPWKLCAFLDEIQPTMINPDQNLVIPSYSYHLITNHLAKPLEDQKSDEERIVLLEHFTTEVVEAERKFTLANVTEFIGNSLRSFEAQLAERLESLDAFFDGINAGESETLDSKEFRRQLQNYAHVRIELNEDDIELLMSGERAAIKALKEQVHAALFSIYMNRIAFTLNKRMGDQLKIDMTQIPAGDWSMVEEQYLTAINTLFEQKKNSIQSNQSEIARNIQNALKSLDSQPNTEKQLGAALYNIASGKRIAINPQNHQRVLKNIKLLNYIFYSADLLKGKKSDEIIDDILNHLKKVSQTLQIAFGTFEYNRLTQSDVTMGQLNPAILEKFQERIQQEDMVQTVSVALVDLADEQKKILINVLGQSIQNMLFRHVLLSNINSLWIEHLTQMEALRVSIGLEAYAQRDPLVQYKNQSTDMFSQLLANIRLGVMSQIFRLQPAQRTAETPSSPVSGQDGKQEMTKDKKRRRRR